MIVVTAGAAVSTVAAPEEVTQTVDDIDPPDPSNMMRFSAFLCTQAAPQRVWLKETALKNIEPMSMTRDTSHREMSVLKARAS